MTAIALTVPAVRTIADTLADYPTGCTVDILTGKLWDRRGAFYLVAEYRPVVRFELSQADSPLVREMIADRIDDYLLREHGNFDAFGSYLMADGHTVVIDAVVAYNGHAYLDQVLDVAGVNAQEAIGIMVNGTYAGSIRL